ncbi:MAG: response regulator [Proteobacteria bacterium]|nr:response regulator [Pseudomonadota bacterium]
MSEAKRKQACLLIVDDEMLNRELLRRVLHRDYEIEEAEDANTALDILERRGEEIQLILCDQLMPGRSGTQLAADVRENWPSIHFLLLTGYDDDPVVVEALDKGLIGEVVAKPWRGSALKRRIAQRLDKSLG